MHFSLNWIILSTRYLVNPQIILGKYEIFYSKQLEKMSQVFWYWSFVPPKKCGYATLLQKSCLDPSWGLKKLRFLRDSVSRHLALVKARRRLRLQSRTRATIHSHICLNNTILMPCFSVAGLLLLRSSSSCENWCCVSYSRGLRHSPFLEALRVTSSQQHSWVSTFATKRCEVITSAKQKRTNLFTMASNDKPQIVEASVSVHHGRQSSLPANVTHHVHFQQPPNR